MLTKGHAHWVNNGTNSLLFVWLPCFFLERSPKWPSLKMSEDCRIVAPAPHKTIFQHRREHSMRIFILESLVSACMTVNLYLAIGDQLKNSLAIINQYVLFYKWPYKYLGIFKDNILKSYSCSVLCLCIYYKYFNISLCAELFQSCLTLCDSMDYSPPGSSVYGILQARILEWVIMPSSRGSSWPRDRTSLLCLLHWQEDSLLLAL